jgi:hypothetical protein
VANAFDIPVLLVMFNRPEQTQQVFEAIRRQRPQQLFVCADGPREGHPTDAVQTQRCRALVQHIDWPCQVQYLFREKNLGCKLAVSGGITWFFEQVDMGIILEDDCLPDDSFFTFCREMLLMYKDDERVMHVSGNSFQLGLERGNASYYFSRQPFIWGWATWRRAWAKYDISLNDYPALLHNEEFVQYIDNKAIEETYEGNLNTWDSQWHCSIFKHTGYCISPNTNMVVNLGFSETTATNTQIKPKWLKDSQFGAMALPLKHPAKVIFDDKADLFTICYIFYSRKHRWRRMIYNRLPLGLFKIVYKTALQFIP